MRYILRCKHGDGLKHHRALEPVLLEHAFHKNIFRKTHVVSITMNKLWIKTLIWMCLSVGLHASDSNLEKNPDSGSSGFRESSLSSRTDPFYERNLTSNNAESNVTSLIPFDNPEHDNLSNPDDILDVELYPESSVVWMDYLEFVGVPNISDLINHLHYELVSTSSKSNLCRIQCVALCISNNVSEDCLAGCGKFLKDDWILKCGSIDCIMTCSHLENMTGERYPSPRPPDVILTGLNPHEVRLSWLSSARDTTYVLDPDAIVYYVIERVEYEDGKPAGNWTFVRKTRSLSVVETLDVCWEGCYRVAAVSKWGSSGYANTSHVDRSELPKPGRITHLRKDHGAEFENEHFHFNFSWKSPFNWKRQDISEFIVQRSQYWCPHFDALKPEGYLNYEYDETSDVFEVNNFEVHQSVWGCNFTYTITPISRCGILGDSSSVFFNLTECSKFNGFTCPRKYEPVTNVTILQKDLIQENRSVFIEWSDPVNPENGPVDISLYRVQWGPIRKGAVEETIELEGERFLNDTRITIQVNNSHIMYGVKIIPLQLVDGELLPNDNQSIELFDIAVRFILDPPRVPENEDHPLSSDAETFDPIAYYILGGAVGLIVLIVTITTVALRRHKGAAPRRRRDWKTDLLNYHTYTNVPFPKEAAGCMIDNPFYQKQPDRLGAEADAWEVPFHALRLDETLGTGAFGQVVRATVNVPAIPTPQDGQGSPARDLHPDTTVAVKLLHEHAEDWHKQDFLKEIDMMKSMGPHPNVVSMLGCCTLSDPMCLIVEHVTRGDLLQYLKHHRQVLLQDDADLEFIDGELTLTDLYSFAKQTTIGMEFLAQKGFVHRDLATRNILVGDDRVVKIGDFGLTRYIYDDKIYVTRKGGKLPLKWMAIEAIFDLTFTTASDVWSFGVVLFELITLGGTPYPTIANKDLLKELQTGYRMEKPETCSPELYRIMLDCWKEKPQERPSFTQLKETMGEMMNQSSMSPALKLGLSTSSEYHWSETESDNSASDVNNNKNNTTEDLRNELVSNTRDTDHNLNDVFNGMGTTSNTTTDTDNLERANDVASDHKQVKKRRKRKKKDMKPSLRTRKADCWRDSTCSHDELLPPSPSSPSMATNVAFICEL